jgi:hypothetical protein
MHASVPATSASEASTPSWSFPVASGPCFIFSNLGLL